MFCLSVNDPLTLSFKNFLHRADGVGIRSLLHHLVRNGVQLGGKKTKNTFYTTTREKNDTAQPFFFFNLLGTSAANADAVAGGSFKLTRFLFWICFFFFFCWRKCRVWINSIIRFFWAITFLISKLNYLYKCSMCVAPRGLLCNPVTNKDQ